MSTTATETPPVKPIKRTSLKAGARWFMRLPLFSSIRSTWDANQRDWNLPLGKFQKAALGIYLVLQDWAEGTFPPRFERETSWQNEGTVFDRMPGTTSEQWYSTIAVSPFGYHESIEDYLPDIVRIWKILHHCGIAPPARVLEIGCGNGWLSEILAGMGFNVIGTTISGADVECGARRVRALHEKRPDSHLAFEVCPMERVGEHYHDLDCVIVYEALHHAFDWRQTVHSVAQSLRPGGYFLICSEPNLAHTVISYRVAKLTTTHEIGISRRFLKRELRTAGFSRIEVISNPFHLGVGWHWIAAQKAANDH